MGHARSCLIRFTVASYDESPMQVLSVDHITGLPIAELFGYECILVIICLFFRFVELYAVQSANADEETARYYYNILVDTVCQSELYQITDQSSLMKQ